MLRQVNNDLYNELANSSLKFGYWYNYDLFLGNIDNRLLYKILKFDKELLKNEPLIKRFKNSLQYLKNIKEAYYKIIYEKKDYFNNIKYSSISKKINEVIKKLNFDDVLFIDMVSNFTIINDSNRLHIINDLDQSKDNNPLSLFDMPTFDRYKNIEYCEQLKMNYNYTYDDNYSDDLFVDILSYLGKSEVSDEFMSDFCMFLNTCHQPRNENTIDFSYLLFTNIYSIEKINEFKNDFYDFLNEFANTELPKEYNLSNRTYNKIKCYLRPLLSDGNIIAKVFDEIFTLNDDTRHLYKNELNFLGAFYSKFKNKYFDIKNEKLNY